MEYPLPPLIVRKAVAEDLPLILQLQSQNLKQNVGLDEQQAQGFVTVQHSLPELEALQIIEPQVVAVSADRVVAYLLAMTVASKNALPILEPMFHFFEQLRYDGQTVASYKYLVVGQVCVDKNFRGQGLLDRCYRVYQDVFSPRYQFAITEIDARNSRSLAAHQRIGFESIATYESGGVEWQVVLWDWRQTGVRQDVNDERI